MSKNETFQSANFKRDYITALAIGIFLLMVASELIFAVAIPVIISKSTLYAEHGTRQKMVASFDLLRIMCEQKNKFPDPVATMEKRLIRWDMDMLSYHLREYDRTMPIADVENVIQDVQQYNTFLARLNTPKPKPFCQVRNLDFDKIVKRIESQLNSDKKL